MFEMGRFSLDFESLWLVGAKPLSLLVMAKLFC